MEWLKETPWLIWLGVALVAGVIEVATVDFLFVMVAGGALIACLTAALGGSVPVQVIAFSASTVLLVVTARPPLKRWAAGTPVQLTNSGALVGRDAIVLIPVTDKTGEVKLAGEVWSARHTGPSTIETGSTVTVLKIDGATAVVEPAVLEP